MAKKPVPSPAANHALRDHQPGEGRPAPTHVRGNGDELHQQVGGNVADAAAYLTDNFGHRISDNQNSQRAGTRGPTLLEDFVLREKIFHFDHERIPERIVHARGSGAHGVFECTRAIPALTKASIFQKAGNTCPVFVRFSTVAGGAGSVDTPRDVRGFAVKLYTESGNWDLVGNNIPVFFIQDAMKLPDLVHSVKMEADRGYPQAASAHDTFWDFIGFDARIHAYDHVGDVRPRDPAQLPHDRGFRRPHLPLRQRKGRGDVRQIPLEARARYPVDDVGRGGQNRRRRSRFPSP